jgi:TDG/mug DNA glycosylase family protein
LSTVRTLPDYLRPLLRLVFVGLNPSVYSVERGHYFARATNRFWPALSKSVLSANTRAVLGRATLGPDDDRRLLRFGIGFTDVVKTPSRGAAALRRSDFRKWAPGLLGRLTRAKPRVACFHGVMAYRGFLESALGCDPGRVQLGAQSIMIGPTRLYVVPNPSPANARFTIDDLVRWYDRLAEFLEVTGRPGRRDDSRGPRRPRRRD